MKWLNIKGLVICIIVFILLSNYLDDLSSWGNSGIAVLLHSLEEMVDNMTIGKYKGNLKYTLIYIEGNNVIAFLVTALLYLTLFARKK